MLTRTVLATLALLLIATFAGCGGSDDDSVDLAASEGSRMAIEEDEAESGGEGAPAADADFDSEPNDSGTVGQLTGSGVDRRVIRSGELELSVSDVNASVRHARDLANDVAGYVDASTTRMLSEDDEIAQLTLEVPSGEFDEVMSSLREGPYVTRVEHESTDSRDVTEEYVDLQSRLGNLESTETRFVALLDDADTIEEILNVEREISRIRGEIEQIKGRMNYLEQRTDFSQIHVSFHPEEDTVVIAGQNFTPGETARDAWNASMRLIGAAGNAVIAVGVFFWWAWPFVLATGAFLLRYRRQRAATVTEATS